MTEAVSQTQKMISNMTPILDDEEFIFCTTADASLAAQVQPDALSWFREEEGIALILPFSTAKAFGFETSLRMRRIVLQVHSALDAVGLTAAVSSALAASGIPCNMVAAFHHDNVFIPSTMADRAMTVLQQAQAQAAAGSDADLRNCRSLHSAPTASRGGRRDRRDDEG
jgi:hypothetical protein